MTATNNPTITLVVILVTFVLGLPVAIAAIVFNNNWVPQITLGTKTINTGPGKTITLEFWLLSGPNDAVYAGALISVASTALLITGLVLIRHFTRHNGFGWLVFGLATWNLLSQAGCCAAAYIFRGKYPVATSTDQIRYVDGIYNTNGELYTREAWACSMDALYADKEGYWAERACSNFGVARVLTIPLLVCAASLLGIALWQIHQRGGLDWFFGRNNRVSEAYKPKEQYIDLED